MTLRGSWKLWSSVALGVAMVAALVSFIVVGSREPAAALHLMYGDAWLANGKVGTASHVNGYTGNTDAQATVGSANDPFEVVQRPDGAYVLDVKTGRLVRLSSSSLGVSASRSQGRATSGLQVVNGSAVTWIVDRSSGLVSRVDPSTLAPLGPQIPLGASAGSASVDPSGTLWVPVPSRGEVVSVSWSGTTTGHPFGKAGDPLEVAVSATGVWGVDTAIGRATHLSGAGPASVVLPRMPSSAAPTVAADGSSPNLVVISGGELVDVNTANASASSYSGAEAAGPVQVVVSGSEAYVLHPGQATVDRFGLDTLAALPPVGVAPGSDQLIAKDNLVFVNAVDGPQAVAVNGAGQVTDITKYKPPPPSARASDALSTSASPVSPPSPHGPVSPAPSPTGPRGRGFTPVVGPRPLLVPAMPGPPQPTTAVPTTPSPTPATTPPPQASSTSTSTSTVPPAAPGMPQNVNASADASGTFLVTWLVPSSNGGSKITGYRVLVTPQNGGTATHVNAPASSTLQAQVTGLTFGVTYCAQVQAVNAVGGGPATPAGQACATPQRDDPGAPGKVGAVDSGVDQVTVSWTKASTGPFQTPIASYTIKGGPTPVTVTSGLSATVSGLQPGTSYTFSVAATNANKHSGPAGAAAPVTTWSAPGAPTNLTVVASNSAVIVNWSAPTSSGGPPVTGYNVNVNGTTYPNAGPGGSFPAAANQSAAVSVVAVNAVGPGTAATGGATPFAPGPTWICESLTRHFLYNWPAADCASAANNGNTAQVSGSNIRWVYTGYAPPGAQTLYFGFVTNWEEWTVGAPAPGSTTPGPVGFAWPDAPNPPYPGATHICEAWTVDANARGGGYYLLYQMGSQPAGSTCWQTFWV